MRSSASNFEVNVKRTVVSHFYNEEYLLPWWLNHHKKYFDHGIMINYASTDKSVNIIKTICPTWDIVDSKNKHFSPRDVDLEVTMIESVIDGWRVCLNTTEFLIGDYGYLNTFSEPCALHVPCYYFVDNLFPIRNEETLSYHVPLWDSIKTGLDISDTKVSRGYRSIHNHAITYEDEGRHFSGTNSTDKFVIFNYGFAPMTEKFIDRKLQIQYKMTLQEKIRNSGFQHYDGKNPDGLTRNKLLQWYKEYNLCNELITDKPVHGRSIDLTGKIHHFTEML